MKKCKKTKRKLFHGTTNKRKNDNYKNLYIIFLTTLIVSYWSNLFLTFDKSIAENKFICQDNFLTLLFFIFIGLFFIKYNDFIKTNEDHKNIIINLKNNSYGGLLIICLTLISQNYFN